jgi:hypothetical protein
MQAPTGINFERRNIRCHLNLHFMANTLIALSFSIFSISIAANHTLAQAPPASTKIVFDERDSLNIVLLNNGLRIVDRNVVAYFPKDSLSQTQMQKIVDTLNIGIKASEKFIHAPMPWQIQDTNSIYTFYFRPDRFISHASMQGYISIPFWRIKNGTSPWLHELIHEMLNSRAGNWLHPGMTDEEADKRVPDWLYEGLADYISLQVSLLNELPRFDVFSRSFSTNTDSLFHEDLKNEKGNYVLSFIGKNGVLPELYSNDRQLYAPAFYHGSCSFVQYIAEHFGLNTLLEGIAAFGNEQETIEKSTGKSLEQIKQMWLDDFKKQN